MMSFVVRVLLLVLLVAGMHAQAERPNILFIFLDDFGWRDAGFMGSDFYETPNLDRLAAEGMVFTDAYAGAANCAPSRACLLSGQYSPRHHIYNVGTKPRGNAAHRRLEHVPGTDVLDPSIRTWAQCFQAAGYHTATMGKWHLSDDPLPYGFDLNIGGNHRGGPPKGYYPPHPNVPGLNDVPADEYLTETLCKRAAAYVEEHAEHPWLLYLTTFAVHTPLDPNKAYVTKYEAKPAGQLHDHVAMATMIESVDQGVGRILEALERTGTRDRTIIILTSDNGGYGPATDMAPLKGYKGTYYEGGIRVPLFVNWPGVVEPGSSSDEPVINLDIYPTLCDMADVPLPADQLLDGVSLVPLLRGTVADLGERAIFWHFPAYLQSYKVYDEQRDPLFRARPCSAMRMGPWKLIEYFEDGALELFNLAEDIGEEHNLVAEQAERAAALHAQLQQWRAATHAVVPSGPNPDFNAAAEAKAIAERSSK